MENNLENLPALLLPWYKEKARKLPWRENKNPYCVWISEIMLQQTRVEAVMGYYSRFLQTIPDIKALAEIEDEKLLKLWEGLGYYSRARNLKKAALDMMERFGGEFPETYAEILSLPGIGPYTAGAISSICFELPKAAVDGNVLRIMSRILNNSEPIDLPKTKLDAAQALEDIYPPENRGDFTQALMELGAVICTPGTPNCAACPVREICLAFKENTVSLLPVRMPKKQKSLEQKTVFLFQCGEKFALLKRSAEGLLGGLWQIPETAGVLSVQEALKAAEQMGVQPKEVCSQMQKNHIFTHIKWEMTCYHILCAEETPKFVWADLEEMRTRYALPTAFRQFIQDLWSGDEN